MGSDSKKDTSKKIKNFVEGQKGIPVVTINVPMPKVKPAKTESKIKPTKSESKDSSKK